MRHRYVASPEAVAIVGDILCDNHARRKTFSAFSPLAFEDQRIPCKTGTSSGFRDGWTVGVTAQHAVGVWVGNFDGRPMNEIGSIAGAAPLWRAVIDRLLERGDTSVPPPVESSALRRREVCQLTGLRSVAASPGVLQEWFLAGTEPAADARRYFQTRNGETRIVLPPEYALWCRSPQNHLAAEPTADAPLRIVSPAPHARFLIDPHLSRTQQALWLCASGDIAGELGWRVDGQPVPESGGAYFWPITAGAHTVEVITTSGSASAEFVVQ